MGSVYSYIEHKRVKPHYRPVADRLRDYKEVEILRTDNEALIQSSRCMNCGTPFCHANCPLENYIPEWNSFAQQGRWQEAWEILSATNPFPEITGRLCPALCEGGCVLAYNDDPVTIRQNELDIIERAFQNGWVQAKPPAQRSGKSVAIIGSGPAALAAAQRLNRAGHTVRVYERNLKPGGFLRYGIPDFKLSKQVLDRRIRILEAEGIVFQCGVEVGKDITVDKLKSEFDAIVLAVGTRKARDLTIPGRDLEGVMLATDYLSANNRAVSGEAPLPAVFNAEDRHVVVIGGGDTGSDCVGTANRHGALSVTQIEILPRPPDTRPANQPWPQYPRVFKYTSSHEEGVKQEFLVNTRAFVGKDGKLVHLDCVRVEWDMSGPRPQLKELAGTEFTLRADMAILALGFAGVEDSPLVQQLGMPLNERGLLSATEDGCTDQEGVFIAGDARRGQSLIVWAFQEGRLAAASVDAWLREE